MLIPHAYKSPQSAKRRTFATPSRSPHHAPLQHTPSTAVRPNHGAVRNMKGSGFLQLPVTAVRPSPWIELVLPDGTVVRLPQQNLAALVTVLRVLRGEPAALCAGEQGGA